MKISNILSDFAYDRIGIFTSEKNSDLSPTARVFLNGKYGYINTKGELIESINKPNNGYEDFDELLSEFLVAVKSRKEDKMEQFINNVLMDNLSVKILINLDLYQDVFYYPPGDSRSIIDETSSEYKSRLMKFRKSIHSNNEQKSLKNQLPEKIYREKYKPNLDINIGIPIFKMVSDKATHEVELGKFVFIDGVWKVCGYPEFR